MRRGKANEIEKHAFLTYCGILLFLWQACKNTDKIYVNENLNKSVLNHYIININNKLST